MLLNENGEQRLCPSNLNPAKCKSVRVHVQNSEGPGGPPSPITFYQRHREDRTILRSWHVITFSALSLLPLNLPCALGARGPWGGGSG